MDDRLVKVAEIATFVDDEIGNEVMIADGVAEKHWGMKGAPSADDTTKEKN